jgi:hypothetical protein
VRLPQQNAVSYASLDNPAVEREIIPGIRTGCRYGIART